MPFTITFKRGCVSCPFYINIHDAFSAECNLSYYHPKMPKLEPLSRGVPDRCPLSRGDIVVKFAGTDYVQKG